MIKTKTAKIVAKAASATAGACSPPGRLQVLIRVQNAKVVATSRVCQLKHSINAAVAPSATQVTTNTLVTSQERAAKVYPAPTPQSIPSNFKQNKEQVKQARPLPTQSSIMRVMIFSILQPVKSTYVATALQPPRRVSYTYSLISAASDR